MEKNPVKMTHTRYTDWRTAWLTWHTQGRSGTDDRRHETRLARSKWYGGMTTIATTMTIGGAAAIATIVALTGIVGITLAVRYLASM